MKEEPVNKVNEKTDKRTCYRCGTLGHLADKCRHKDTVCRSCNKKGHLAKVCRSKSKEHIPSRGISNPRTPRKPRKHRGVRHAEAESETDEEYEDVGRIRGVKSKTPQIQVPLKVDGVNLQMEVDTGASVSLMSEKQFKRLWPTRQLQASSIHLRNYSNELIPVVGKVDVQVTYEGQVATLPLVIVEGDGPTLFGRNWLQTLRLNWSKIHSVLSTSVQDVLGRHEDVFQPGLGEYKGFQAQIDVDPEATPRFHKARTVPYSQRAVVDQELDRLV